MPTPNQPPSLATVHRDFILITIHCKWHFSARKELPIYRTLNLDNLLNLLGYMGKLRCWGGQFRRSLGESSRLNRFIRGNFRIRATSNCKPERSAHPADAKAQIPRAPYAQFRGRLAETQWRRATPHSRRAEYFANI